jgi:DNA processing protein
LTARCGPAFQIRTPCENIRSIDEGGEGVTAEANRERAAVLALAKATGKGGDWSRMGAIVEEVGSALRVIDRSWDEPPADAIEAERLAASVEAGALEEYLEVIDGLPEGVRLITVLDDDYPSNLRMVFDRPPFLFVRGELKPADSRGVAIVGTRRASAEGERRAAQLARAMVEADVTVFSGMALGIDAAAHRATLAARGRTVAVMGTGIRRVYPAAHRDLADEIVASGGALVSQFWPDAPPTQFSFPMRNAVMSGLSIGTVVIEASKTSGARTQARLALQHGKRLFLVESLVMQEPWASDYAARPGATVVKSVEDVLDTMHVSLALPEQLTLG